MGSNLMVTKGCMVSFFFLLARVWIMQGCWGVDLRMHRGGIVSPIGGEF